MDKVKVKWIAAHSVMLPYDGGITVNPGDIFEMPLEEAVERNDVEVVTPKKEEKALGDSNKRG